MEFFSRFRKKDRDEEPTHHPTIINDEEPIPPGVPQPMSLPSSMVMSAYDVGIPHRQEPGAVSAIGIKGHVEEDVAIGGREGVSGPSTPPSHRDVGVGPSTPQKDVTESEGAMEMMREREELKPRDVKGKGPLSAVAAAATTTTSTTTMQGTAVGVAISGEGGREVIGTGVARVEAKTSGHEMIGIAGGEVGMDVKGMRDHLKKTMKQLDQLAGEDVRLKSPEDIHHLLRSHRDLIHSQSHLIDLHLSTTPEIHQLRQRELDLLNALEASKNQCRGVEVKYADVLKRLAVAEEGVKRGRDLEAERGRQQSLLNEKSAQVAKLEQSRREEVVQLNTALQAEKSKGRQLEVEIGVLRGRVQELEGMREELRKENETKKTLEAALSNQKSLLHQLQTRESQLQSQVATLNSLQTSLQSQLSESEGTVSQLRMEREEERKRVGKIEEDIEKLRLRVAAEVQRATEVGGEAGAGRMRERFAEVVNRAEEINLAHSKALTRIQTLESTLTNYQSQHGTLNELSNRLAEVEKEKSEIEEKLATAVREIETAKEESRNRELEMVKRDMEVAEMAKRRGEGLERVNELMTERQDLKSILASQTAENQSLRSIIMELMEQGTPGRNLELEEAIDRTSMDVSKLKQIYEAKSFQQQTVLKRVEEAHLRPQVPPTPPAQPPTPPETQTQSEAIASDRRSWFQRHSEPIRPKGGFLQKRWASSRGKREVEEGSERDFRYEVSGGEAENERRGVATRDTEGREAERRDIGEVEMRRAVAEVEEAETGRPYFDPRFSVAAGHPVKAK
ncbi:hypothetical protein HDU67_008430 [Dinochytrium kinnereticum]|nr:hypothetical protein HDU67_008430 [Dinochytrium kinnereticum]